MAGLPPPEGMTEDDYDSIHAAVVETVRGRWFLAEYARRSRVDEVQEMLSAIGRLEKIITGNKALPLPSDVSPHARLLAQRADEIAVHLFEIAEGFRESGADPYLCDDLDAQIRAISGLPKGHSVESATPLLAGGIARQATAALEAPSQDALPDFTPEHQPDAVECEAVQRDLIPQEKPAECAAVLTQAPIESNDLPQMPRAMPLRIPDMGTDPRLAALAALDRLTLAEKLSVFS